MLLDKKNAGLIVKIAAGMIALAFIAAYIPGLFQDSSTAPQTPQTSQSNQQIDARAQQLKSQLAARPKDFARARELGDLYWDAGGSNAQAQDASSAVRYFRLATEAYAAALKLNPKETDVRTDMATAYYYSGDSVRAKKELLGVLTVNPKHPNALFNLGLIAKQTGDVRTARAAWQKYLQVEPSGANADKVRQELPTLK